MSKILVLANSSAGLCSFRRELIDTLLADNEVIASVPFSGKEQELIDDGVQLVETVMDRRGMNPIRDIALLKMYYHIVKSETPKFVITYTIKSNIYGGIVSRLLNVSYAANITGLGTAFERKSFLQLMITILYKIALRKAKVVFFENSENLQVFLDKNIINRAQAKLLNGAGVNLNRFYFTQYPKNNGETVFLFIGRIMAEKGINELFDAMRKLHMDGINCSLDIVGRFDEDFAEEINKAQKEGWLTFHGYQADVRPYIQRSHCFVLPSWHEGMANTNLECAAMGRPLITTDIAGCREAVEDNVTGYLCEKKNSTDLYLKMKKFCSLSEQKRSEMGRLGRKRMEILFDKEEIVRQTFDSIRGSL